MKLFKCIGFAVLITVFVANIFMVCVLMENGIENTVIGELQNYSEKTGETVPKLVKIGTTMEQTLNEMNTNSTPQLYPVLGVNVAFLTTFWVNEIIGIILGSILIGVILGTIVYLITEKKYTGIKLLLHLIVSLAIILTIVLLLLFGYNCIISRIINEEINGNNIFQILNSSIIFFIVIVFIVLTLILYSIYYIYQKTLAKKLNDELNK